jgi:hypothetical protein
MTPQPSAAVAGHARTLLPELLHQHNSVCFWDVDDCHWQCAMQPTVGYDLERCTAIGRADADSGPEAGR